MLPGCSLLKEYPGNVVVTLNIISYQSAVLSSNQCYSPAVLIMLEMIFSFQLTRILVGLGAGGHVMTNLI